MLQNAQRGVKRRLELCHNNDRQEITTPKVNILPLGRKEIFAIFKLYIGTSANPDLKDSADKPADMSAPQILQRSVPIDFMSKHSDVHEKGQDGDQEIAEQAHWLPFGPPFGRQAD